MPDLLVVVPSRGRPEKIRELLDTFDQTCTANTKYLIAIDADDPVKDRYHEVVVARAADDTLSHEQPAGGNMCTALNRAATSSWVPGFFAIAFMGDDHRPRTVGWDQAYVDALRDMGTGIVYGNDLLQGEQLPTQVAMTADIVRALGYMAPPELVHLALDDWWLALGRGADCIRYLPDVVVEHVHPMAGKADWDAGYARVNAPAMYSRDLATFERLQREKLPAAIESVRALRRVSA